MDHSDGHEGGDSALTSPSINPQTLEGGAAAETLTVQPGLVAATNSPVLEPNSNPPVQPQSSSLVIEAAGGGAVTPQPPHAIASFAFANPLIGQDNRLPIVIPPPSLPKPLVEQPPAVLQHASGGSTGAGSSGKFSSLSAEQLVDTLRQKIPALDREAWIDLGLDGSSILEVSAPSLIAGQLTDYLGLKGLIRDRTAAAVKSLVIADDSIDIDIRKLWGFVPKIPANQTVPPPGSASNPVHIGTPVMTHDTIEVSSGSTGPKFNPTEHLKRAAASPLQPSFLFAGTKQAVGQDQYSIRNEADLPQFLSEVAARSQYSLEHASMPPPATNTTTMIPNAGGSTTASAIAAGGGNGLQNISITLHQPTQQKYNWVILDNLENRTLFMTWVKKNRRERIICDQANQRSFASLLGADVRDDVIRTYQTYPQVFPNKVTITSYSDISDELLMHILFFKFGPRNALDAKLRLSEVKFRFDDSTTFQDRFAPKLRRYCAEWRQTLLDFKYTCKLWPQEDDLSHQSIVDAFLSCFKIEEDIVGPDGKTKVPKCTSMQAVRDMIRENKHQKLDAIIDVITRRFENADATIRSDPLLKHSVQPWRTQGQFNAKKRKYNQAGVEKKKGKSSESENAKSPSFPRCNNCGSKGHPCTERRCYFWGHSKGKGPQGVWQDGEASLRLSDEEFKEWKGVRHSIFYSYPEIQKTKRPTPRARAFASRTNTKTSQPDVPRARLL